MSSLSYKIILIILLIAIIALGIYMGVSHAKAKSDASRGILIPKVYKVGASNYMWFPMVILIIAFIVAWVASMRDNTEIIVLKSGKTIQMGTVKSPFKTS